MNKFEGNTMTISHFTDFYYLEAISAQITMAISANPEIAFRHSVEKLEADVKEAFAELTKQMAFRIYVYLWAASLGEVRYAKGFDLPQYIEELSKGTSRQHAYGQALEHFPSDKNVAIVKSVFNQHWGGSYGGRAWLSIVEGMELYGKVSDATFIDHAVDLEHNGGCVFNKSAKFGLDCTEGMWNTSQLRRFLDFKFSHNILEDKCIYFSDYKIPVTRKVYNLINRYWNVICKVGSASYIKTLLVLDNLNPVNPWLTGYSVDWGHEEFTLGGKNKTIKTTETKKTVKVAGQHIHRVRDGHSYLVKHDGYGHGVGFVGQMRKYDGRIIRVARHDKDGYAHGFIWARQWLYSTKNTAETTPTAETITVKVNNVILYAGKKLSFVSAMKKYCGQVITLTKKNYYGSEYYTIEDGANTWYFEPEWYEIVTDVERRERYEVCDNCGDRVDDLYNGLCETCYDEKYQTCDHCGDECRSEDTIFSDITYQAYCETCHNELFTVCDKCGQDMMRKDSIDCLHHPTAYHMHESCAREEMHKCWECDEWFPKDETVSPEDDYDFYCLDCVEKKGMKCETCGKIYYDIDAHIKENEENDTNQDRHERRRF